MAFYSKRKVLVDLVVMEDATSKKTGNKYNQCYIELPWQYGKLKMFPMRFCDDQELAMYKGIFDNYNIMQEIKSIGQQGLEGIEKTSDQK